MRRRGRGARGQAAVETALIMPFFVFLILGLLQLGLLHQARVLTKYAAFKAVRTGTIRGAEVPMMERAALAVLLPMAGRRESQSYFNASVANFQSSWSTAKGKQESGSDSQKLLKVMICEPFGGGTGDFDDPDGPVGEKDSNLDWKTFNKGRLAVQVTFYHQMVIPFVNGVLWMIVSGQEQAETMRVLRMNKEAVGQVTPKFTTSRTVNEQWVKSLADQHIYIMPIRASWSLRMQSNFKGTPPGRNECKVPWNT